jgi:hypothetical protein
MVARQMIGVRLAPDGPVVLAAVNAADLVDQGDAFARAADVTERLGATGQSVQEALDSVVMPTASTLMDRLRQIAPDAVEIEFGLELSGKTGLVFASAEAAAHFSIKLSWQAEEVASPPQAAAATPAASAG